MMRLLFFLTISLGSLGAFSTGPADAADGKTIPIGEQAYVSLRQIAKELNLEPMPRRSDPSEVGYAGGGRSLVVKGGSRQSLINGVRHWLSYEVESDRGGALYLSREDIASTLLPVFDPKSGTCLDPVRTVVFDPGHGGHDRGGHSVYGNEKDYALDTVNRARRILEGRGVEVVQSRLTDFFVPLAERPTMTKNYEDPIFVSVHFNSASWRPAASGFEIFVLPPAGTPATGKDPHPETDFEERAGQPYEAQSYALANAMYGTLLGSVAGYDRGVRRARFSVLRNASVPAVLVEGGFLSNPEEAKKIHSPAWREAYAKALADGIIAYIQFANEGVIPPTAQDLGRAPTNDFVVE